MTEYVEHYIDYYGFQVKNKNAILYEKDAYPKVLERRRKRWETINHQEFDPGNKKFKRFIRKGIPRAKRGEIWFITSGAAESMEKHPKKYKELCEQAGLIQVQSIHLIDKDLHRTFPDHDRFFADVDSLGNIDVLDSSPNIQALQRILVAHAVYNQEVGYCQGLNFVAGMILLVVEDEAKSFWILVRIVEQYLAGYFSHDMASVQVDKLVMSMILERRRPRLHQHLSKLEVSLDMIMTRWFLSIFVDCAPTEAVLRIWDLLFSEGVKIFFRIVLALFVIFEAKILSIQNFGDCYNFVKDLPARIENYHDFIKIAIFKEKSIARKEIRELRVIAHSKAKDRPLF